MPLPATACPLFCQISECQRRISTNPRLLFDVSGRIGKETSKRHAFLRVTQVIRCRLTLLKSLLGAGRKAGVGLGHHYPASVQSKCSSPLPRTSPGEGQSRWCRMVRESRHCFGNRESSFSLTLTWVIWACPFLSPSLSWKMTRRGSWEVFGLSSDILGSPGGAGRGWRGV